MHVHTLFPFPRSRSITGASLKDARHAVSESSEDYVQKFRDEIEEQRVCVHVCVCLLLLMHAHLSKLTVLSNRYLHNSELHIMYMYLVIVLLVSTFQECSVSHQHTHRTIYPS